VTGFVDALSAIAVPTSGSGELPWIILTPPAPAVNNNKGGRGEGLEERPRRG